MASSMFVPVRYSVSDISALIGRMNDERFASGLAEDLRHGSFLDTPFFGNLTTQESLQVAKFALSFVLPGVLEMVVRFSDHFPSGELSFDLWYYLMSKTYRYDPNEGVTFSDGLQGHGSYSLGEPSGVSWIDYPRLHNIDPYDLIRFVKIVKYAWEEKNIHVFKRPYGACVDFVRTICQWNTINNHRCRRQQRFYDIFRRKVDKVINPKYLFEPTFAKEECPICYETIGDFVKTNCGHVFHGTCLKRWIRNRSTDRQTTCPYCRSQLVE